MSNRNLKISKDNVGNLLGKSAYATVSYVAQYLDELKNIEALLSNTSIDELYRIFTPELIEKINEVVSMRSSIVTAANNIGIVNNLQVKCKKGEEANCRLVKNTLHFTLPKGDKGNEGRQGLTPILEFYYDKESGNLMCKTTGYKGSLWNK